MQPEIYVTVAPYSAKPIIDLTQHLAAAGYHSLVLAGSGEVLAFGQGRFGQNGDDTLDAKQPTPVQVQHLNGPAAVGAGQNHSLAIRAGALASSWGQNHYGQLGIDPSQLPLRKVADSVPNLTGVLRISGGWQHSLALVSTGEVYTWGNNNSGQLGYGASGNQAQPSRVSGPTNIRDVAAGGFHNLAFDRQGAVWAWGKNRYGQLGDGSTSNRTSAKRVAGLPANIRGVAAGKEFSLVLAADGTVWGWGDNSHDQMGQGAAAKQLTPRQIPGLADIMAIAAGAWHGVALTSAGTVLCWGINKYGQLGDGSTTQSAAPVEVAGLSDVLAISANGGLHTLAVTADQKVWSWGANQLGQLGVGSAAAYSSAAAPVPGVTVVPPTRPKPKTVDFGSVEDGQQGQAKTFVIENYGTYPLTLGSPAVEFTGADAAQFQVVDAPSSPIAPGATVSFTVRFAPSSTGAKGAALVVNSDDPDDPIYTIPITGQATAKPAPAPVFKISATEAITNKGVDFGEDELGHKKLVTFTIENTGTADLTLDGKHPAVVSGDASFTLTSPPTKTTLAPKQSTTFVVQFEPTTSGDKIAALVIPSNAEPNYHLVLHGKGIGAQLELKKDGKVVDVENTCDFGSIKAGSSSAKVTYTITNIGGRELLLTGDPIVALSGPNKAAFKLVSPPSSPLTPGESTTFVVQFVSTQAGSATATLTIASNDEPRSPITITLEGVATSAVATPIASRLASEPGAVYVCTPEGKVYWYSWFAGPLPRALSPLTTVEDIVALDPPNCYLNSKGEIWAALNSGHSTSLQKFELAGDAVAIGSMMTAVPSPGPQGPWFEPTEFIALCSDGSLWSAPRTWKVNPGNFHQILSDGSFTAMSCGHEHCVFLSQQGTVWTYGRNGSSGELGPRGGGELPNLTDVVSIAACQSIALVPERRHSNWSAALKSDGTVWWWGRELNGPVQATPKQIDTPPGVKIQALFGAQSLVMLDEDGYLWMNKQKLPFPPSVSYSFSGDGQLQFALTKSGQVVALGHLFSPMAWAYIPSKPYTTYTFPFG